MIRSYMESLKLATYFILIIPSNPMFPISLQPTEWRNSKTYFAHHLTNFYTSRKNTKSTKVNGKIRKKWTEVKKTKNFQNASPYSRNMKKYWHAKSSWKGQHQWILVSLPSWVIYKSFIKIRHFISILHKVRMDIYGIIH